MLRQLSITRTLWSMSWLIHPVPTVCCIRTIRKMGNGKPRLPYSTNYKTPIYSLISTKMGKNKRIYFGEVPTNFQSGDESWIWINSFGHPMRSLNCSTSNRKNMAGKDLVKIIWIPYWEDTSKDPG